MLDSDKTISISVSISEDISRSISTLRKSVLPDEKSDGNDLDKINIMLKLYERLVDEDRG